MGCSFCENKFTGMWKNASYVRKLTLYFQHSYPTYDFSICEQNLKSQVIRYKIGNIKK